MCLRPIAVALSVATHSADLNSAAASAVLPIFVQRRT
jgi:hypothetical protein